MNMCLMIMVSMQSIIRAVPAAAISWRGFLVTGNPTHLHNTYLLLLGMVLLASRGAKDTPSCDVTDPHSYKMFCRCFETGTSQEGVSLKDVHPLGGYEKLQPKMAAAQEGSKMTQLCF